MTSQLQNDLLLQASIYIGVWNDWNQGSIKRLTLTTTRTNGAVLIALLALFVQLTGTHAWGILRFLIHQLRVDREPRDALHNQQQIILRNFSSADTSVWMFKLGWAWRKKGQKSVKRSLPLFLIAVVHLSAFLIAAIFSASASTSSGDAVLVSSQHCGSISDTSSNLTGLQNAVLPYSVKSIEDSANYARSCYSSDESNETAATWHDCSTYATPRLPTTRLNNATCPFATEICTAPSFQLDTGPVDSLRFGMNAPLRDRITWRKMTNCAPMAVDGFSAIKNGSSISNEYTEPVDIPELEYIELYYGKSVFLSANGPGENDYTYRYHTHLLNFTYLQQAHFPTDFDYFLSVCENTGTLLPIAQINRSDADITLIFLSQNSVVHDSPVDDPWYAAHSNPFVATVDGDEYASDGQGTENGTIYFRDQPVSPLGCVEQYQICGMQDSSGEKCTPLVRAGQLQDAVDDLQLSAAQLAAANVLSAGSFSTRISQVVLDLGTSALLAKQSLYGAIQSPLPPNQWTLEVESWANIALAQLQRTVLEYATGPANPDVLPLLVKPTSDEESSICRNQIARTSKAQNFSVLAIIIILVLGFFIVLVDLLLGFVVGYVQHRHNPAGYRRLAWITNSLLQLQRLAYEDVESGDWDGCVSQVPVTHCGQRLAPLDLDDPEHPKLQRGNTPGFPRTQQSTVTSPVSPSPSTESSTEAAITVVESHADSQAGKLSASPSDSPPSTLDQLTKPASSDRNNPAFVPIVVHGMKRDDKPVSRRRSF